MTTKDYKIIADVLANAPITHPQRVVIAEDFVGYLEVDNPRFDADKFKKACGLTIQERTL
jgi:hypothetical protein